MANGSEKLFRLDEFYLKYYTHGRSAMEANEATASLLKQQV